MIEMLPIRLLAALSAFAALTVSAQTVTSPAPASPAAAAAAMPPYRSTFEGYQPFTEEKVAPWKQTNDTVGKIGGWRAYAKEAREVDPKDGPAPAAKTTDPHAGHGKP